VGIATNIKTSAIGLLVQEELAMLGQGINHPTKPFVAILGGAKVSDKIGVIENLLTKVDKILIGGGMAYTFFAAQGYKIGKSLLEADKLEVAKEYLAKGAGKIILPVDSANATDFKDMSPIYTDTDQDMPDDLMGLDIGPKTIELFKKELANAKTVV
jgi:phosphoglycerate kinase